MQVICRDRRLKVAFFGGQTTGSNLAHGWTTLASFIQLVFYDPICKVWGKNATFGLPFDRDVETRQPRHQLELAEGLFEFQHRFSPFSSPHTLGLMVVLLRRLAVCPGQEIIVIARPSIPVRAADVTGNLCKLRRSITASSSMFL